MDALPNGAVAGQSPTGNVPELSSRTKTNGPEYVTKISQRKYKRKKKSPIADSASSVSSASSNNGCSSASLSQGVFRVSRNPKRIRVWSITMARRSVRPRDVDALGLPLGMSIAAVVAQVLERANARGKVSVDHLSKICILAVRESLVNIYGDKFDSFVENFEKSFRSTLMTLKLINESSQNAEICSQPVRFRERSCSGVSAAFPLDRLEDSANPAVAVDDLRPSSPRDSIGQCSSQEPVEENIVPDLMKGQLVLHSRQIKDLACGSESTSLSNSLMLVEKTIMEQTRANNLKSVEIGLMMKKIELKEKQLSLNSDLNLLERCKLSMGFSKASFKAEKFKSQFEDMKQVELLKICLDLLVAGLMIMLVSLSYATYVFSHRRITEATEACSPPTESKSWWMPKSMSAFNTGLHLLKCQIQVLSRMLFGILMIGSITFLLLQRSSTSQHSMPITFILLLLGFACGYAGKFCIDTLGGSGKHWLIYWEALCLLHFLSHIFRLRLFVILNGPISVAERIEYNPMFPYWTRKVALYATMLILPLFCGLLPFASFGAWVDHFSSQAIDYLVTDD